MMMLELRPPILALFLLVPLTVPATAFGSSAPAWVVLDPDAATHEVRVEPLATAATEVALEVRVPGLETQVVETPHGPRGLLQIPGAGVTSVLGHPRLPALRFRIETPPGSRIHLELTPASVERLRLRDIGIDHALVPVQPPAPKIEGVQLPFIEDVGIYSTDGFLAVESAVVVERAVLRGRHVATIEVRPVRYNPAAGLIEVWSRAELRVAFVDGTPSAARRDRLRLASPRLDGWIDQAIVAGPDTVGGSPSIPLGPSGASQGALGMLVIAHDDFVDALQPLLDWKEKTGYRIELLRTSQIADGPTDAQVKAEIQLRYDTWSDPPLDYLLLVGDTDFCPIHLGNGGGSSQVTDNWYACLDGTDYLPEIAVARISTRSAAETADVVDKLLTYERATFLTDEWIKTAGFIGTNDSGHYGLIEGTHDWCIDTHYTPNGYLPTPWSHGAASCDRHYKSYDASTFEIAASIDAGRSIVNYSGHGGYYSWEGPTSYGSYDQSDVLANTNDGMYPFVISNACITGTLELPECFGETWQKAAHRGAIAFWGASNNSYWDEDDVLQRALHDNIFPMDTTPPIGVLVNQTKLDLYDYYGSTGSVAYYFDMYNLLSEPSLDLWTRPPRAWEITHPASHPIGESALPLTVTYEAQPVAGALVAVRKEDDGVFEAAFTDSSGQATLLLDPAPESVGTLELTVTGHDFMPYEGTVDVISPDSPWLVHRSHLVDDTLGGDGDGSANPGEEFVMPVTVENVGHQPGNGLQATLTTSTPQWCDILDGNAGFPDIPAQEEGTTLPDHFKVRVSHVAPDGASIGFDLAWSATGGASGVTSFSRQVQAVELALESFAVDDTAQGNGNGVAGPGETVTLSVGLENTGHRNATGITAELSTESPSIEIQEGSAGFPDIPASAGGDSIAPHFSFSVSEEAPDQQVTFALTVSESGSGYQEVLLFDVPVSSCSTADSTDVPKPIDDNSTVESELDYALPIQIDEVNVFVDISHTYQGDLRVILVSPSDTSVVLHDRTGGSADDILTWYDTETAPAEDLSVLVGENAFGVWRLVVEDHAGGDVGVLNGWSLEICGEQLAPDALLTVTDQQVDDGTSCNPDGMADVGETVTWRVRVRNEGWSPATEVRASLASSAQLAVLNNPVALPDLQTGEEAEAPFEVLIGALDCMEQAQFTVEMEAQQGYWSETFVETLEADLQYASEPENLEHQGAEPDGWTHAAAAGVDDWQVVDDRNHTTLGAWSWFASDAEQLKDDRLVSPAFPLGGGNPTLEFHHWVDLESGYDGGVLEISVDDGQSWIDLGPSIVTGPYDRSLGGDNPISGRDAWSGSFDEWRHVVVDLTPWVGQTARFRWRLTCDASVARSGWWVDDILLLVRYEVCDVHPCGVPGEVQLQSVAKEGTDVLLSWGGDPLCIEFGMWRSVEPSSQEGFTDVTPEDPDPTDTIFRDPGDGDSLYWIVVGHGPDGDGPWGHFEP